MNPTAQIKALLQHMVETASVDELVEIIYLTEQSRNWWKNAANQIPSNYAHKRAIEQARLWDGEIAAWKRR
jgi:hypothetical protein